MRLQVDGHEHRSRWLPCTDAPGELGVQDYVDHHTEGAPIPEAVDTILPLLGPAHDDRHGEQRACPTGSFDRRRRCARKRDDTRESSIRAASAAHASDRSAPSAASCFPGDRESWPPVSSGMSMANKFPIGEPSGERSRSHRAPARHAGRAGSKRRCAADIRDEIWLKLWGNLCFNPISALTLRDRRHRRRRCRDTRGVPRDDDGGRRRSASASACACASAWSGGSTARPRSGRTRCRCCRISSAAGPGNRAARRRRAGTRAAHQDSDAGRSTSCWRSSPARAVRPQLAQAA